MRSGANRRSYLYGAADRVAVPLNGFDFARMHPRHRPSGGGVAAVMEGLRYIRDDRTILVLLLTSMATSTASRLSAVSHTPL